MKTKNLLFPLMLSIVVALIGCDDEEPAFFVSELSSSDIPISNGFTFNTTEMDAAMVNEMRNQNTQAFRDFDFSNVTTLTTTKSITFNTFSDPTLPSANLSFNSTATNTITGGNIPYIAIRELTESGYYNLGRRYPTGTKVSVLGGAGELTFKAGDYLYAAKRPILKFPFSAEALYFDDFVFVEDFTITLPSEGLNNTPANTVDSTYMTTQVVDHPGGPLKLPTYGTRTFDVLKVAFFRTTKRNYLLNGAAAPVSLLAGLGLTDGEETRMTEVVFYSPKYGAIAGYHTNRKTNTTERAWFRNDIPE